MTPTLKELLGRANLEHWNDCDDCTVINNAGYQIADTGISEGIHWRDKRKNAQLIARCSPSTMALVLSALDEAQKTIRADYEDSIYGRSGNAKYAQGLAKSHPTCVDAALAALNGTALNKQ